MTQNCMIGHNNPPTPFEEITKRIDDLYAEAQQWLDGEPIETQKQADAIAKLQDEIRNALQVAEELRVKEKQPYDEGAKAVQAKYNPYTQKDKGKAPLAIDACKKALLPYLEKLQREQEEKAAEERRIADEKRKAAEEAMRATHVANLEARAQAEKALQEAKEAEKKAAKTEKQKAHAHGSGRALGLRTVRKAVIVDYRELARHVWAHDITALHEFLDDYARKRIAAGGNLPGVDVVIEKTI